MQSRSNQWIYLSQKITQPTVKKLIEDISRMYWMERNAIGNKHLQKPTSRRRQHQCAFYDIEIIDSWNWLKISNFYVLLTIPTHGLCLLEQK